MSIMQRSSRCLMNPQSGIVVDPKTLQKVRRIHRGQIS